MTLIVCVDDNMGMLFNHRRQSKDVVVRERILKQAEGKHLWMNHYSAKQFDPEALINADESYMNEAAQRISRLQRTVPLPITSTGSIESSCINGTGVTQQTSILTSLL